MSWRWRRQESAFSGAARPAMERGALERRTTEIGRQLLAAARQAQPGVLSAQFWSDQLMNWAMHDPVFKVQLFRFIDVLPMLRTPERVYEYLADYLSQPGVTLPQAMNLGLKVGGLAKGLMAKTITGRVAALAHNFIAGIDARAALPTLKQLWDDGVGFSVDLLGEACVSEEEARVYQARYLELAETLSTAVAEWDENPLLESDYWGPVRRSNMSIKISSLCPRTEPIDFEGTITILVEALRPILEAAGRNGVLVNFDMEQAAWKDLTMRLFQRCCEQFDFPAGLAMQAYLRSGIEDADRMIAWARRSGRQVTVRLIKGAYWDYETVHAERMNWPTPVWKVKRETDANFERMADRFVAAVPRRPGEGGVKLAVGSHNIRSIAYVLALLEQHDLPTSAVEFQKLYGMADQLRAALVDRRLRVREYVPVGEMLIGMAYLVRRLLENTSNQSWLRASVSDQVPEEVLLASPQLAEDREAENRSGSHDAEPGRAYDAMQAAHRHALSAAIEGLGDGLPMLNEPFRDFAQEEERGAFAAAIAKTRVPVVQHSATAEEAKDAITRAAAAFPAWRDGDPVERSAIIVRAADLMRERRDELSAIMIREAGKTWREADADACEAIDMCEYYARQAVPLFEPRRLGRFIGELNHQWYQARGVVSVISPWNFPLAICCGMTSAALAVGNAAVVKPSSQTRGIAKVMCEIFWQAGVPKEVLHFVPGAGRAVGDVLVRDPRVAMIAFTGSKEVGLAILRAAGETPEGQGFVKKVVCEMGGKNAIIVDESADLDEAVLGVRHSAFSYAGQKCSACSRAIVVEGVHDAFLKRLVESTRSLVIGDPAAPATDVGPVIDDAAAAKICEYIEIGRSEGVLELACSVPAGLAESVGKPYVGPHIFSGIGPSHRLANEEIFGPVLSVMRVRDLDEALQVANATEYKLTGGVFSRKPSHLQQARREFRVGNLYLNRGITGALVGRQPFGGFGLSGIGSKAGGSDYLLHFVEPRCSTENTMRHGFAPGVE